MLLARDCCFSTLLGGSADDLGNGIAVDGNGNIYVVGATFSTNFPTVNAIQSESGPIQNCGNGFVTKIDPAAPSYVFSTYLGGSGCDDANSVAVDTSGNVYLTGRTELPKLSNSKCISRHPSQRFNSTPSSQNSRPAAHFLIQLISVAMVAILVSELRLMPPAMHTSRAQLIPQISRRLIRFKAPAAVLPVSWATSL